MRSNAWRGLFFSATTMTELSVNGDILRDKENSDDEDCIIGRST